MAAIRSVDADQLKVCPGCRGQHRDRAVPAFLCRRVVKKYAVFFVSVTAAQVRLHLARLAPTSMGPGTESFRLSLPLRMRMT